MTAQGKLVVISGPSGAGKTSVCKALKQQAGVEFSVSATTRAMRPGEIAGVDYHFLAYSDFEARAKRASSWSGLATTATSTARRVGQWMQRLLGAALSCWRSR